MKRTQSNTAEDPTDLKKAKLDNSKASFFQDFDLTTFWQDEEEDTPGATVEAIAAAEKKLGHKLPGSYIELLQQRNGGAPKKQCSAAPPTSWADDHIMIEGIFGVGDDGIDSEDNGSEFWFEEWGYPRIGVVIADCPSAGHDLVMLDYSECGTQMEKGEPRVVHVDQEADPEYKVTVLAPDFATWIKNLKGAEEFNPLLNGGEASGGSASGSSGDSGDSGDEGGDSGGEDNGVPGAADPGQDAD